MRTGGEVERSRRRGGKEPEERMKGAGEEKRK